MSTWLPPTPPSINHPLSSIDSLSVGAIYWSQRPTCGSWLARAARSTRQTSIWALDAATSSGVAPPTSAACSANKTPQMDGCVTDGDTVRSDLLGLRKGEEWRGGERSGGRASESTRERKFGVRALVDPERRPLHDNQVNNIIHGSEHHHHLEVGLSVNELQHHRREAVLR